MPIDPATVDSGRPRTYDGREYPEHLKVYEGYDEVLLPILASLGEATMTDVAAMVDDAKVRSIVPRWMASAEWRVLIKRTDRDMRSPRTYRLTERGEEKLTA